MRSSTRSRPSVHQVRTALLQARAKRGAVDHDKEVGGGDRNAGVQHEQVMSCCSGMLRHAIATAGGGSFSKEATLFRLARVILVCHFGPLNPSFTRSWTGKAGLVRTASDLP